MFKNILLGIFALSFVISVVPCYSQEEDENQTVMGTVAQVDFAGSKIILSTFQGDVCFFVPKSTPIYKGDERIVFADVDIGDGLTIQFHKSSSGELEADNIIDSNLGNE